MYQQFREKLKQLILMKLGDAMCRGELRRVLMKVNPSESLVNTLSNVSSPYQDHVACDSAANSPSIRDDIVFITGRFRSGSTMLWSIFRQLEGFTAYYEPFNERRWFDSGFRGDRVDGSHLNVADYWREYDGCSELADYYDEDWIRYGLYMDEASYNFKMKRYIELLIDQAKGRPVLQFNRIDFRLPWVKANFPNAKILHIFRNPRDQWCSFIGKREDFPLTDKSVFRDRFYLDIWATDLERVFPFLSKELAPHPYQRFYLLWKLSYIFGRKYADYSVAMEVFTNNVDKEMQCINELLGGGVLASMSDIVIPQTEGKWREYVDEDWFYQHEIYCESILRDFFIA